MTLDPAVALPVPPEPAPDDPRACATSVVAAPSFIAEPDRPCTEERYDGTTTYRYDATGRIVYRAVHSADGNETVYTSEVDGDIRIETVVEQGRTKTRDVISLKDGKPVEASHFEAADDGTLVLDGHTTWLYDDDGRKQYVISQFAGRTRKIKRYMYDSNGRPYFVDENSYWPGSTNVFELSFTSRSYYENGNLAHEVRSCGDTGGAPCTTVEQHWEPCGNLAYYGSQPGNFRNASFTDWAWDQSGRPAARHQRWNTTSLFSDTTETYRLNDGGRAISGTIVTVSPPGYLEVPQQQASYTYDDAGRLIEAALDGKTIFQARYDTAGRLVQRTTTSGTIRWTYDGCGR